MLAGNYMGVFFIFYNKTNCVVWKTEKSKLYQQQQQQISKKTSSIKKMRTFETKQNANENTSKHQKEMQQQQPEIKNM